MSLNKKSVDDINVKGKRVLCRCDFNVPLKNGEITDENRLVAALPTIKKLIADGGKVILCSHLGKVKTEEDKQTKTLAPVAKRLTELLGQEVKFVPSLEVVDDTVKAAVDAMKDGEVILLENTRFRAEETKNGEAFSKDLASICDVFVNDAFGTAHRAHASTAGVASYLPAVAGFLMEKELNFLGTTLENPERPFVAILGGKKVSDKIGVIDSLLEKVDTLMIGGGMAYTFFKAQGYEVGNSICEVDKLDLAKEAMEKAKERGVKLMLPVDTKIGKEFKPDTESKTVKSTEIPDGWEGLDIGEETIKLYREELQNAKTIVWNGPLGVFEFDQFAVGTNEIAKALGDDPNFATTITNKLTELKGIIDKEISDRTAADEQVTQKFTELSTTLNATVSELRTFVTETRSELLTKAQAQDELIAKNTANIQRNLELIQGLQSNQNTGYLEIKELLNTEIEARKAEDIRIEAKVDKNTQDLTTERNERIAADKVLQDNIDAEEAARIAADNALGKRIDKEIEDRKAADTALENKFNDITNGLDERLQKEEATSEALPLTMVTEIDPNLVINGTSAEVNFKSSVKGEGNLYGEPMPRKFAIPASTDAKAGLQSAADKKRWNSMPNDYITGASYTPKAGVVTTNISRSTYNSDEGIQKSNDFTVDIPASTAEKAGVQTAADKKLFNSIPQTVVVGEGATSDANKVTVSVNRKTVNEGIYKDDNTTFDLPVASTTKAGTMSAADKVKLDETLPNQITKEIQDRKDAIEALKNSSEASLTQEIEDRKAADQALDTKFTQAIKEEADARAEYDQIQMQKIQEEEEARAAADTALENKLQTNINNLEKKHDDFVATKGKANGFASLDGNGLVPSSQLPSYVDDVIEVYATYDVSETGKLSNIKLYSDSDHANPITGESGKIYLNITQDEPSYQFRWSGTQFVDSNTSSLILGEVTGTAYDGGKGKALANWRKSLSDNLKFYSHIKDDGAWTRNATEVRLNFDCSDFGDTANVNTYNQPIPAATKDLAGVQTAADKKLFDSIPGTIIISGKGVVQNTDKVWVQISKSTKADGVYGEATTQTLEILAANANRAGVLTREMFNKLNSGLNGDITNALNEAKAYTDAAKTALEKLIQDSDKVIKESLDAHIGNKSNPHNVTKAQIGLGNVQNLAPAGMPVSTAQAAAIADAKAAGTKAQTDLSTHANRRDNPHNVTRAQLGLATTDQVVFAKTTAASGFWKESDGRLKSQVENLNHTLDQICNIPTVHFKMNGKYQVGTIAQSLEEIEPLLVSENTIPASQVPNQSRFETFVGEDGQEYVKVKVVEYEMLSVMALEGVKLLRKEFEDFKKQLNNK